MSFQGRKPLDFNTPKTSDIGTPIVIKEPESEISFKMSHIIVDKIEKINKKRSDFVKIAITSMGNNLDSEVSPVFARSPYFIVADLEYEDIKKISAIENPSKNERGAGISAAQFIANKNVDALISGAVGPNAFNLLNQVGIKVYKLQSGTVKDNLKLFTENKLDEITSSSSGGPIAGGRAPGRRGGMGGGRQI